MHKHFHGRSISVWVSRDAECEPRTWLKVECWESKERGEVTGQEGSGQGSGQRSVPPACGSLPRQRQGSRLPLVCGAAGPVELLGLAPWPGQPLGWTCPICEPGRFRQSPSGQHSWHVWCLHRSGEGLAVHLCVALLRVRTAIFTDSSRAPGQPTCPA